MADVTMLVDDFLLKELSAETRKIGSRVVVRKTLSRPAFVADIMDIIIVPQSDFYRSRFVAFYESCNRNSVKALKELHKNFPFAPDYNLGIGYILNFGQMESSQTLSNILLKGEFEIVANSKNETERLAQD